MVLWIVPKLDKEVGFERMLGLSVTRLKGTFRDVGVFGTLCDSSYEY